MGGLWVVVTNIVCLPAAIRAFHDKNYLLSGATIITALISVWYHLCLLNVADDGTGMCMGASFETVLRVDASASFSLIAATFVDSSVFVSTRGGTDRLAPHLILRQVTTIAIIVYFSVIFATITDTETATEAATGIIVVVTIISGIAYWIANYYNVVTLPDVVVHAKGHDGPASVVVSSATGYDHAGASAIIITLCVAFMAKSLALVPTIVEFCGNVLHGIWHICIFWAQFQIQSVVPLAMRGAFVYVTHHDMSSIKI